MAPSRSRVQLGVITTPGRALSLSLSPTRSHYHTGPGPADQARRRRRLGESESGTSLAASDSALGSLCRRPPPAARALTGSLRLSGCGRSIRVRVTTNGRGTCGMSVSARAPSDSAKPPVPPLSLSPADPGRPRIGTAGPRCKPEPEPPGPPRPRSLRPGAAARPWHGPADAGPGPGARPRRRSGAARACLSLSAGPWAR